MNSKYKPLYTEVTFNNGSQLDTRFVMAPMVAVGSSYSGQVGNDDINYFLRRSDVASMLITGATAVSKYGNAFGYGLQNIDDSYLPGLTRLAESMKTHGNKAIMQLFHPGQQARFTYKDEGVAYGPSDYSFDFIDYPITGLTDEQIKQIITDFADATVRAIKAGFDGVEIHGANHYLIQQFFSKTTNIRQDDWGGSLEKRAAFPLAIVEAIKDAIAKHATEPFILGYRFSPEEIHGDTTGYNLDDSLYLIDRVASLGVDYIHSSLFGAEGYKTTAKQGQHAGKVINQVIKEMLDNRSKLVVVGDIVSPEAALDALYYGDLVGLASIAIVDPDFRDKIYSGNENEIDLNIIGRVQDLHLPKEFYRMVGSLERNGSIPSETTNFIRNNK